MSHGWFLTPLVDDNDREEMRDQKRAQAQRTRSRLRWGCEVVAFMAGVVLAALEITAPRPATVFVVLAMALMIPLVEHMIQD